jgi:hypothetical protein
METSLETDDVTWVPDAQDAPDVEQTGSIIWNYYKIDGAQSKQCSAKNAMCTFCDSSFTGCSTSRAHILGRAFLGQKKTIIGACVPIRREDDNRYAQFNTAQKVLNKELRAKEQQLSPSQRKQTGFGFDINCQKSNREFQKPEFTIEFSFANG